MGIGMEYPYTLDLKGDRRKNRIYFLRDEGCNYTTTRKERRKASKTTGPGRYLSTSDERNNSQTQRSNQMQF